MIDIKSVENTIINDDCLNVLKQLPDKCVSLVVTDIPYDISVSHSAGAFGVKKECTMKKN